MSSTLCDTFKNCSKETWDMLAKGRDLDHQIGEETLIDINILKLKSEKKLEIYNHKFTKHKEGSNGADWEWWFTGASNKWIGFRVQAKVIDFKNNSFNHLYYYKKTKSKNKVYQCDLLIENASKEKNSPIPLYCFYSNWNDSKSSKEYLKYNPIEKENSYGCSIISAFIIQHLRSKKELKHLTDLLKYMQPWHSLVCCHGDSSDDLPSRVLESWRNSILQSESLFFERFDVSISQKLKNMPNNYQTIYDDLYLSDVPPKHVQLLLNNDLVELPDSNLGQVTIIKERKQLTYSRYEEERIRKELLELL
ncbi:DUF6615 family protein [Nostoc sp. ChiSLP03a]|uniref:DUF6615 family protein n=1 Tax=Nostoc sp. ChiSLP03a TaxID=3075380 RepID=UPI002AD4BA61|nr:DUF6615 family protein [Nostoc sp. ChiSLP03a]MDZ8214437.1 DUF6615 family protein [Nostoc sp. ChiSLP03a]